MGETEQLTAEVSSLAERTKAFLYERLGGPFYVALVLAWLGKYWQVALALIDREDPRGAVLEQAAREWPKGFTWDDAGVLFGWAIVIVVVGSTFNLLFTAIRAIPDIYTRTIQKWARGQEMLSKDQGEQLWREVSLANQGRTKAEAELRSLTLELDEERRAHQAAREQLGEEGGEPTRAPKSTQKDDVDESKAERRLQDRRAATVLNEQLVNLTTTARDLAAALQKHGDPRMGFTDYHEQLRRQVDAILVAASRNPDLEARLREIRDADLPNKGTEEVDTYCDWLLNKLAEARERSERWALSIEEA